MAYAKQQDEITGVSVKGTRINYKDICPQQEQTSFHCGFHFFIKKYNGCAFLHNSTPDIKTCTLGCNYFVLIQINAQDFSNHMQRLPYHSLVQMKYKC